MRRWRSVWWLPFLSKPFTTDRSTRKVREVLDERGWTSGPARAPTPVYRGILIADPSFSQTSVPGTEGIPEPIVLTRVSHPLARIGS